ncbi:MAG: LysM peptidoglycan-binding domain-containing protein [Anaerolineales bacterium]|nr:LysM peptidoglycan-binding domain-containing protein [Anaerolineales bacterium]
MMALTACAPASNADAPVGNLETVNVLTAGVDVQALDANLNQNGEASITDNLYINYGNCSQLYAVQPGDSLDEIARISRTTEEFVLNRNGLENESEIFPGLVLCLETANGENLIPPKNGVRSGVEVTDVSVDKTVTVRGVNFPAEASMNVYMLVESAADPNVVGLGEIAIPADGTFERQFQIPEELDAFRNLIIRFRNPDENVSATANFINANVERVDPEECIDYVTVRSGDILGTIAQDENVSVQRLMAINNLVDATVVFPGQMLCTGVQ